MRKMYSLVLTALFLLVGTNTWGQTKTVQLVNHTNPAVSKNYATLQAAIDAVAPGDTATITLLDEQELTSEKGGSVVIPNVAGESAETFAARGTVFARDPQRICLNLGGYNITGNLNSCCIALVKGVLHITGEGEIIKNGADVDPIGGWTRSAIAVSGAPGDKNDASKDRSKVWWSLLTIDEGVKVTADNFAGAFGISIMNIGSSLSGSNGNMPSFIGLDRLGYFTYNRQSSVAPANQIDPMWFRADASGGGEQGSAFGVKLVVKGEVYGKRRGINVLGHVNQRPEAFPTLESGAAHKETRERYTIGAQHAYYYEHTFPWIIIESTAKVHCIATGSTKDETAGIYSAGWCVLDISGDIYGQNGIFAKAGNIHLDDANIYSTSSNFAKEGIANGNVSGNGIFLTTDVAYAGDMSVGISGDTRVAGGSAGAAIIDVTANPTTQPDVNHIDIQGGTIEGGAAGAIVVTNNTATNTVAYGGTNITGTVISGNDNIGTNGIAASGTFTTYVTDPVTNKTTVVVSNGSTPEAVTEDLSETTEDRVKWTGTEPQYILEDKTLEYLEMNPTPAVEQIIYVGDNTHNVTLSVERVVFGTLAKIIVAPGSKFIVTGAEGIVAPKADNIILQANPNKQAYFLFHPEVTSNRHPNATVEFVSNSYVNGGDYAAQRFGIPTYGKLTEISTSNNVETAFAYLNYENDEWTIFGYINSGLGTLDYEDMKNPFAFYQMVNNTPTKGTVVTMKGTLYGNESPTLPILANKWNGYANSFMAPIKAQQLMACIPSSVDKSFHVYEVDAEGDGEWVAVSNLALKDVKPLQAFLLRNTHDAANVTINYAQAVYAPMVPSYNAAPAHRNAEDGMTMAKLIVKGENHTDRLVVAEDAQFSAAFDNGYDAAKYMNDGINMYVSADEKMAIFATDNLENTYVGFQSVKGGAYTIAFEDVQGENLMLIDHETGARVAMVEGNVYEFSTDANSENDYRFEIVASAKMPTSIENIDAVKNAKGIYTITGQYVGEMNMWNSLPAGVYVVDGAKRVK